MFEIAAASESLSVLRRASSAWNISGTISHDEKLRSFKNSARFYAGRIAGGNRHHRHSRRTTSTCRAGCSRSRPQNAMPKQPTPDWPGGSQLRICRQAIPALRSVRFNRIELDHVHDSLDRHCPPTLSRTNCHFQRIRPYFESNRCVRRGARPSHWPLRNSDWRRIHKDAKGLAYNDPNWLEGNEAAKNSIAAFLCPTTPLASNARDPVSRYGGIDYMFAALTDIDERPSSATFKMRTPTSSPDWSGQVRAGILSCEKAGFGTASDGSSNIILCLEDASRAHPSVSRFGALSSRSTPVPAPLDPINSSSSSSGLGRRVYAWADADAVTNGVSGPSNAIGAQNRIAKFNNHSYPIGGPPHCLWQTNNCGPNDEPYSFHTGGLNAAIGDGSVRFLSENVDALVIKNMIGANDGNVFSFEE